MSLNPQPIAPVPSETVLVAQAAFPKGNLYLRLRDELGVFYTDCDFENLYSVHELYLFEGLCKKSLNWLTHIPLAKTRSSPFHHLAYSNSSSK
jgi:transposase